MFVYILRRLPQTILVIFGVTLVTFIALQIGGDPTYLFISDRASPEEIEATRIKLGFDKPLYIEYFNCVPNNYQIIQNFINNKQNKIYNLYQFN